MQNAHTKVVDLQDEVERLDDEIEDVLDEAEDLDPDSDDYEQKDVQYKALNVQKEQYSDIAQERGSKFKIRELSFGEISHIRDEVLAMSDDPENPREGLYQVKVLEKAVVDSPVDFSDDPKEWSPTVAEYVYDEIDALNSGVDEETLGNFALDDALAERTQSE